MNRLDHLIAAARERSNTVQRLSNVARVEELARQHFPRGFRDKLYTAAQKGPAVIAELKRASPSQGVIRADFAVARLAERLCLAGASALSVLTEDRFFQGHLNDLETASRVSGVPCLRKDFIVDEFQIIEARARRADAVLLILAALKDSEFRALLAMARALELDTICEVHDEKDLDRALAEGVDMIGVNSRDLRDFSINMTAFDLIAQIPESVMAVAESGISSGGDIRFLRCQGYQAFLIGQTLMASESPGTRLKQLLSEAVALPPVTIQGMKKGA